VVVSVLLLANAAYLLIVRVLGWAGVIESPDLLIPAFYQAMILSHTGLGLLLLLPVIAFVSWHLKTLWFLLGNRRAKISGLLFLATAVILTVTGLFIMTEANSRSHRWAFWLHISMAFALPLLFVRHRLTVTNRLLPAVRNRGLLGMAALALVFLGYHVVGVLTGFGDGARVGAGVDEVLADPYPSEVLAADARVQGQVPSDHIFFPSPLRTITGGHLPEAVITRMEYPDPQILAEDLKSHGFLHREAVGDQQCARCHPDSVEQWKPSAHRFSSFNNPFYRATVELLREEHGFGVSQWCGGCHDPALMPTGVMAGEVDPASPAAQAGLTCLACHGMEAVIEPTGNGNFVIQDETVSPYLFDRAAPGTLGALLHDTLVKARPNAHRKAMRPDHMGGAEFCGACHKVSLSEPINGYRWLRGQDEYDNWHDSGVSLNASRTFYLPSEKRVCQDCHMPLEEAPLGDVAAEDGQIRSHRFLAVNTALPHLRGDTETLERIERFLQAGKLSVDLFALRVVEPETLDLVSALNTRLPALEPGQLVELYVVVRNLGVGHTFPGGTNDSNEGWLDLRVSLGERELLRSGVIDEGSHVDPSAHFYKAVAIDAQGRRIDRRDAQNLHTNAWSRVIGPGTADLARYRFRVPADAAPGALELELTLKWRKFRQAYTDFVFGEGERTDFPITNIAQDRLTLQVVEGGRGHGGLGPGPTAGDWIRFNDLGIGALLQGDTRMASQAFAEVDRLVPERLDGPRNLARIAIVNGDLQAAYELLRECERRAPGDPQSAWFWGRALMEDGRYDDAAAAFRAVLERFTEDRAAHRMLGRVLYLDARYEEAVAAFEEVLKIDPEDRVSWYHIMLSHRALGDAAAAARAEAMYRRFSIDESAQEASLAFLSAHPHDNNEAQRVHYHTADDAEAKPTDP
jgi:Flp pilus assembly protein TadD